MKITKEVKTGLLAVFAIATFILGYNYLKGKNLFNAERSFYAVYDNVEGLDLSSVVTINGLKVGKIQEIAIQEETGFLVVKFNIENDFRFSKTSIAKIYGGGIIGGKSLAIIPDFESDIYAIPGDTLAGNIEEGIMELVNDRLTPLQLKIENSVVTADSLLASFSEVMNPQTRENMRQSLANLAEITASFKTTSKALEELLGNNKEKLNNTIENLDITTRNFASLSDSLAKIEIGTMVKELESTISNFNTIAEKINKGEGSIGKLLQDDALYDNLEGATLQLEQLLEDMKLNPKRYVHFSLFGKRPGPYETPENK